MSSRSVRSRAFPLATFLALAAASCTDAPTAAPTLTPGDAPARNATADYAQSIGFRRAVTLAGVREHQAAFQAHADANGGTRVTGTPGFEASVAYVAARAAAAGYAVTVQSFSFEFSGDRTPPVLQRISPAPTTFVAGTDFTTMAHSGSGDVTAPVYAVDLQIPAVGVTQGSGCEAADFAGFPAGNIALIQRGGSTATPSCTFATKAQNAQAAGATGVIIFNEGNTPERLGVINGTLGENPGVTIPVVGASFAVGQSLANGVQNGSTGVTARLKVDFVVETRTGKNVIAESPGGDADHVIVVGARLDGDVRGPAINATSGAAAALEIAETFAAQERSPTNRLRFVWFGGMAQGLVGSTYYVGQLAPADRARIAAMLGMEALGSPNFGRFVYDAPTGPAGSDAIAALLTEYFAQAGLTSAPRDVATGFASDHRPFADAGIPFGGVYGGSFEVKTPAQQALFDGTAGVAFDPCYQFACDTFANVSLAGLDQLTDAAAHGVLLLSRRNLVKSPLAAP